MEINNYLWDVSGVIHVGASRGQEWKAYDGLWVVWIEAVPEISEVLKNNIKGFPKHRAFQALITDIDDKKYRFRIANRRGDCSSILDLKMFRDLYPKIVYKKTIILKSITLTTLCQREQIDLKKYDALVLDTQGSELLVLNGAIPILDNFKYIKVEVPNFEAYKRCPQVGDIENFMNKHGYKEFMRREQLTHHKPYYYYDIVYKKHD